MADDDTPTDAPSPDVTGTDRKGADLAAETLASVRRSSRGHSAAQARKDQRRSTGATEPQFTGSGPDDRDPALLGESLDTLMRSNGWAQVKGRWCDRRVAGNSQTRTWPLT